MQLSGPWLPTNQTTRAPHIFIFPPGKGLPLYIHLVYSHASQSSQPAGLWVSTASMFRLDFLQEHLIFSTKQFLSQLPNPLAPNDYQAYDYMVLVCFSKATKLGGLHYTQLQLWLTNEPGCVHSVHSAYRFKPWFRVKFEVSQPKQPANR